MTAEAFEPSGVTVPPAFIHIPPSRSGSLVRQVSQLSAAVGTPMDPEQRLAVDVATSLRADGRPATLESAIITCRQNLKTFCAERIVLTRLVEPETPGLQPIRLVVWSAHEFTTAQESFRHFDELIAGHGFLSRRVLKVSRGNGDEAIEFTGGPNRPTRRLMFKARIKTGGRGLTGDIVVLDEAFALQPSHMGSLLPTLSTRRRAQVIYCSSAGLATSAILRGIRDRGRAGGARGLAYIEWCAPGSLTDPGCRKSCTHAPGTPGCSLDREDYWLAANPAMARPEDHPARISPEFVQSERDALSLTPGEFARERLGWWDQPGVTNGRISKTDWTATAADVHPTGPRAFFITIEPGMLSATIAVASDATSKPGALPHVELADHRPGVDWLARRVRDLKVKNPEATFAAGKAGPVKGMLTESGDLACDPALPPEDPDLDPDEVAEVDGVPIELVAAAEWVQACALTERLVSGKGMTHHDDGYLSASLDGLAVREGEQGTWSIDWRKSTGNPAPFAAGIGALFTLDRHRDDAYDPLDSVI